MSEISELITKIYPYFLILFVLCILLLYFKFKSEIFNTGFKLIKKCEYEKAIEKFKNQIIRNPKNAASFYGMGWCYYMLGDNTQAIKNFKLSIEFKFREVESYFLIGLLYSEKNEFEKALDYIEEGKKIQKKKLIFDKLTDFQMNEIIGWIYHKNNDIDISFEFYKRAIPGWEKYFKRIKAFSNSERFSSIYYRIGVIYKEKNDREKSKEFLEKSIASAPNSIFAKKSKEELKKM